VFTAGYGRSRYDKIRAGAPDLGAVLDRVREIGLCQGPVMAYAQLYGGSDYDGRTSPGTTPRSRIDAYGPAFFTKFLYFTVPGALILDARLAGRVAQLTGREYGYLKKGRPVAWTPYLHWMRRPRSAGTPHRTSSARSCWSSLCSASTSPTFRREPRPTSATSCRNWWTAPR
jgi:hypothetical protein